MRMRRDRSRGNRPGRLGGPGVAVALALALTAPAAGQVTEANGPAIRIARAAGEIRVDGDLGDAGWAGAAVVDTWYQTNPGDNVAPAAANRARLAYDAEA